MKDLDLTRLLVFLISKLERTIKTLTSPDLLITDVTSLEAVAELRTAFGFTSDLLYHYATDSKWTEGLDNKTLKKLEQLFKLLLKSFSSINSVHPRFFFLRQLLRKYGSGDLRMIVQKEEFNWLWSFQDHESVRLCLVF